DRGPVRPLLCLDVVEVGGLVGAHAASLVWVTGDKLTEVMEPLELIRDFVNTADLEDGEEKLADPRALQYWLVFHGLAELRDRASGADLARALEVREALRELLREHTGVEADGEAASAVLDAAARN